MNGGRELGDGMRSAAVPTGTGRVPTGVVWDSSGAARALSRLARVAIGAVALAALTLTGCTPAPTTTPPPTPSAVSSPRPTPSATPSPTPTPDAAIAPERPAAMDEVNAAGAEAVAVYFLELFPYVYATGDLTTWRELSHPECIFCSNVIAGVEEMLIEGNHSEGGLIAVSSVTSSETTAVWWMVTLGYGQEPSQTVDRAGRVREEFGGASAAGAIVVVVWDSDRWLVRAFQHAEVA